MEEKEGKRKKIYKLRSQQKAQKEPDLRKFIVPNWTFVTDDVSKC